MKAKIGEIPFDETKKVELKTAPKPKLVIATMKALVYNGTGEIELKDVPIPTITKSTDALVKVLKTTICGTDLGILKGKVPTVKPGTTLGHEGVGVIEQVGDAVRNFKKGDHVIISCITSDGTCEYCKKQMYAHCKDGGWILGHTINGTQAEYCLLYTSDAADERSSVDLGGRRIIKKKKKKRTTFHGRYIIFFFKQKTAYEMLRSLVGSEMCIRDRRWMDTRAYFKWYAG